MSDVPLCEKCGCPGNQECLYPPDDKDWTCELDRRGYCPCCLENIDRMTYRPEEDGQEDMFK